MEASCRRARGSGPRERRRRAAARRDPLGAPQLRDARFGPRRAGQNRRAGRNRSGRDRPAPVVGSGKGARVNAIDTTRFREALLDERRRVAAAIDNLHDDHPGSMADESGEDAVFDNHLADTATETYDRELDYTLEENSEHVLADIDAALQRIEEGSYGTCTNCGRQIAPERLEARPWGTPCIDCPRPREGPGTAPPLRS